MSQSYEEIKREKFEGHFAYVNKLSPYSLEYKCDNDCQMSGCPSHIAEFIINHAVDTFTIKLHGQEIHLDGTEMAMILDFAERMDENYSQRDADKGGEKCTRKCGSFKGMKHDLPITKEMCDCPCHSPKPQANVGENWEVEFDARFAKIDHFAGKESVIYANDGSFYFGKDRTQLGAIKDFISNLLSTTSAQKLESVGRETRARVHDWVEVMWKNNYLDGEWTGTDEIEASLNSYLEGNHLKI